MINSTPFGLLLDQSLIQDKPSYISNYLDNMTKLTKAGAIVLPASPGFYNLPKSIDELVNMVSSRVLEKLGIVSSNLKEWEGT